MRLSVVKWAYMRESPGLKLARLHGNSSKMNELKLRSKRYINLPMKGQSGIGA